MAYATNVAGSKLRAKLGASLNENVSAPTSDFAQQQLQKMGWSEGDGLGKSRQGMSSHIVVRKREDEAGLGHTDVPSHGNQWWKDSLGDTLAKLGGGKKKKKKKRHYTDEELFEATGGARFGMRAQRRAEGKWKRTESSLTEEDEREAQSRVEWNGQGNAEVKMQDERPNKRQRKGESSEEEKMESDVVSDSANETSSGTESSKKKRRKDKKSKKGRKAKKSKKEKKTLKRSESAES